MTKAMAKKAMTRMIGATVLALAISICARAGDGIMGHDVAATGTMQYDKTQPPPAPPPAAGAAEGEAEIAVSATGIIQYDVTAAASQAALGLMQSLLGLF